MENLPPSRKLIILYGSQTGNAQDVAELIARQGLDRCYSPVVQSLDDYDVSALPNEEAVVFVVSTTGDGEAPDNMKKFYKFILRKSLPSGALSTLKFALFGLGDSSYPKYNAIARRLYQRLLQLGAAPLCDRGLGDDQSTYGMEGDLDVWLKKFWTAAAEKLPLAEAAPLSNGPSLYLSRYKVSMNAEGGEAKAADLSGCSGYSEAKETFDHVASIAHCPLPRHGKTNANGHPLPFLAPVVFNERLTAPDWNQNVRHIQLSLEGSGLSYEPGDVAKVCCQNTGDGGKAVLRLCDRLQLKPQQRIDIETLKEPLADNAPKGVATQKVHFRAATVYPSQCTIEELFSSYLDINGLPRRFFFEQLSFFARDEEQSEKLLELSSPSGADLYFEYIVREKRTYVDVLEDFATVEVPLSFLLELIPPLQPREFSIASSMAHVGEALELCVAVVEYETPYKRPKVGVCSSWLSKLEKGAKVPVWIKQGAMKMPPLNKPWLLVGPGTGVAPMRSFLQYRRAEGAKAPGAAAMSDCDLFFGCRHEAKDFLFAKEWEEMQAEGALTQLHTAFSRDQKFKVYVQKRVLDAGSRVVDLLMRQGGFLYIAGSSNQMPNGVEAALQQALQQELGYDEATAAKAIRLLKQSKRIMVECWS